MRNKEVVRVPAIAPGTALGLYQLLIHLGSPGTERLGGLPKRSAFLRLKLLL